MASVQVELKESVGVAKLFFVLKYINSVSKKKFKGSEKNIFILTMPEVRNYRRLRSLIASCHSWL
jgi:hypothetical protein